MPTSTRHTVAIIYGLNEGPFMGRRLCRALREAGYDICDDPTMADIIIAHSGGCFIVESPRPGQRIIMIGLPYWPGRSLLGAFIRKVLGDLRTHHREGELAFWWNKSWWNLWYARHLPTHLKMFAAMRRGDYWQLRNVTIVRNHYDTGCTPDLANLPFTHSPHIVELPGHHDDCWRNPGPIVRLVQAIASKQ